MISCVAWAGNWLNKSITVLPWASLIERSTPWFNKVLQTSTLPQMAASCNDVPAGVLIFTSKPAFKSVSTTALKQIKKNQKQFSKQSQKNKQR